MVTQEGDNVGVCSVVGNFDDAQTGVKKLFSDEKLRAELARRGYFLSSANSINWGRVLPQIVYYISAYCDLLQAGKIQLGAPSQRLRAHGQLRQYSGRPTMPAEMGVPMRQADLCLQRQQRPHRLHPHRRVRPEPHVLQHHVPLHGHSDFQQSGAAAAICMTGRDAGRCGTIWQQLAGDRTL